MGVDAVTTLPLPGGTPSEAPLTSSHHLITFSSDDLEGASSTHPPSEKSTFHLPSSHLTGGSQIFPCPSQWATLLFFLTECLFKISSTPLCNMRLLIKEHLNNEDKQKEKHSLSTAPPPKTVLIF